MTRRCGGLVVWTGGLAKRWQLEFCFLLLSAEAVFAERDKTWFLWQGKGKADVLYILGQIHLCFVCLCVCFCETVWVSMLEHFHNDPKELFNMLTMNRMHGKYIYIYFGHYLTNTAPCWLVKRSSETYVGWRKCIEVAMKSHFSCVPIPTFLLSLSRFWVCSVTKWSTLKEVSLHPECSVEIE